jgi:glucan phosphoethanolaminetransferase (alkaline phosphatase superfamily)
MRSLPPLTVRHLTRVQIVTRFAIAAALGIVLLVLRDMNPETAWWVPLRSACGKITGLPCIFCGTTRALHLLLNGEFSPALYFNWIAFPVAAAAFAVLFIVAAELTLRRELVRQRLRFQLTGRRVALFAGGIAALWIFQVAIAVGQQKRELLDESAPLSSVFVR